MFRIIHVRRQLSRNVCIYKLTGRLFVQELIFGIEPIVIIIINNNINITINNNSNNNNNITIIIIINVTELEILLEMLISYVDSRWITVIKFLRRHMQ